MMVMMVMMMVMMVMMVMLMMTRVVMIVMMLCQEIPGIIARELNLAERDLETARLAGRELR